jgi:hypothetical protein
MGDSMIEKMPKRPRRAESASASANQFAPPFAPMVMPKQSLTPDFLAIQRAFAALITRFVQLKLSFRRIG